MDGGCAGLVVVVARIKDRQVDVLSTNWLMVCSSVPGTSWSCSEMGSMTN